MTPGLEAAIASVVVARLGNPGVLFVHVCPPSMVFQIPPPTEPANQVRKLVSDGSTIKPRVRPPTLFGPRSTHGSGIAASYRARRASAALAFASSFNL